MVQNWHMELEELGEFPRGKVKVTMLKDRKKGQRSKCCTGMRRGKILRKKLRFFVGFPPVKCRHLTDSSQTNTIQIRVSHFFKLRQNGARGYVASPRG